MFGLTAKPLCGRYLCSAGRDRSRSFAFRATPCRRSLAGSGEWNRQSPESRGATPPPEAAASCASCDDSAMACRACTSSPPAARRCFARTAALRTYVEERLSGVVAAPSGAPGVPGPVVSWKSRRHGPRKDRRWANAWSLEQIARRLPVDSADDATMRISHEAIYQALFVQGRSAPRPRTDGLPAAAPGACCGCRGRARAGEARPSSLPRSAISQRPAGGSSRSRRAGPLGSADLILGLGSSVIGTFGGAHDALHSAAIPAAHGGPWPRGSREERARTRRSSALRRYVTPSRARDRHPARATAPRSPDLGSRS